MSAAAVLALLPECRSDRPFLLCVDGLAGSGKSTVAAEVAADFDGTSTVVHTDDLCPGWGGLPQVPAILTDLVEALASGRAGSYPRYDWIAGRVAEDVVVEPADLVILEGVGAGCRALRSWRTALVWLECPVEVRRTRALARDGATFAPYWDAWADAERVYLTTEADRDRADLILQA